MVCVVVDNCVGGFKNIVCRVIILFKVNGVWFIKIFKEMLNIIYVCIMLVVNWLVVVVNNYNIVVIVII